MEKKIPLSLAQRLYSSDVALAYDGAREKNIPIDKIIEILKLYGYSLEGAKHLKEYTDRLAAITKMKEQIMKEAE